MAHGRPTPVCVRVAAMRSLAWFSVALAIPTLLGAQAFAEAPVIGGSAAPAGKWPDAVAVLYGGQQECTGTLIAPNVVITAGHCVLGGAPDSVLIGASALSRSSEGERITVVKAFDYPSSQTSIDVG